MTVVDLGAAPGSWCQVAVPKAGKSREGTGDRLASSGTLPGVESLEGDFTEASAFDLA